MVVHHAGDVTADVTVEMGKVNVLGSGWAVVGGRRFAGSVWMSAIRTWHVWIRLSGEALAALEVGAPVEFDRRQFPEGVNVEVLTAPVNDVASMRVHERVSGRPGHAEPERWLLRSRPCTTQAGRPGRCGFEYRGEVDVEIGDTSSRLRGPSVLVARARSAMTGGRHYRRTCDSSGTLFRCTTLAPRDTIDACL